MLLSGIESVDPFLEKIRSSQGFQRSLRLQRFLRFIIVWAIDKPGEPLKEYSIAVSVYDKNTSFDPQTDPIIRVEASRLRSRLIEYYAGPGSDDPIVVELPKGTYVPLIRPRHREPPASAGESIAVIPWHDGAAPDLDYLRHGICESLTRRLAHIPNLRVAPWSMSVRSGLLTEDLPGAAKLLGVRTLLVLRLRVRGESYQVDMEWLDPEQKAHLWGCRHDCTLPELHAIEDELILELTERIAPRLTTLERNEIRKHATNSGNAYHLYLKGRYLWNKRTSEAMKKAIQYYRRALDEDPAFALAFAGMADSYLVSYR